MLKYTTSLIVMVLLIGCSQPAAANPINDIVQTINKEINKAKQFFDSLVSELDKIENEAGIVINNVKGELGLLDLKQAENSIETELEKKGELNQAETLKTIVEAKAIASHSDSILGTKGQQEARQTQYAVNNSVETVAALEKQASNSTITQDVMKQIAAQNSQMAAINSSVFNSLEGLKQTTAYNNRAVAKQIMQQKTAELKQTQEKQASINNELAAVAIFKTNLYGSRPCKNGQKTAFITKENGVPIAPKKICQ